jgi:hypothetical protein
MKRGTVFMVLLIGVSFTLTACYSRYDRNRDYRRGGGYYQFDQVRALANDLEDATDRAYDRAEDYARSDREDYALDRLEDLRDEASDFRDEVDDRRGDPRDTRDNYQDLVEAYYRAREGMRSFNYGEIYREFDRVSRIMAQLNRVYGGPRDQYGYRYR